jgi:hypothetical protein
MSKFVNKLAIAAFAAIALTVSASQANAVIISKVIDNFLDDSAAITGSGVGDTATSTTVEGVAGNIFGTQRDVFVNKTAGPTTPAAQRRVSGTADGATGSFFIDRGPLVNGNVLVQWDGVDIAPSAFDPLSNLSFLGGPWDLSSDAGILVRVTYGEPNQEIQFTLFSSATSASTHAAVAIPNFPGPGTVDLLIPFASFAQSGLPGVVSPADFTDVRAMTMTATSGVAGRDVEFTLLGVYMVPEPATATIFGIGSLVAMATFRRFRPKRRQ